MCKLKEEYEKNIIPSLMKKLGLKNKLEVPCMEKIVINVGMGEMAHQKELIGAVEYSLSQIAGQKPAICKARKSISNFKIREGNIVGFKVTLRKKRMYNFMRKLIDFVIPRIRDFRGIPRTSFDHQGNYTLGLKEQTIFPELDLNKIKVTHGMDICFVTTAKNKEWGMELLDAFGMPFVKKQ